MILSLCKYLHRFFTMPFPALAMIAAGVAAFIGVYLTETYFGAHPCILCLYQRVPYGAALAFGILALGFRRNASVVRALFWLCAVVFFVNVGIAFFHTGVELHWWAGTDECAVNPAVLADPEAARKMLLAAPVASCDKINFTFLGFTLANWNVLICFALGAYAALAARAAKS